MDTVSLLEELDLGPDIRSVHIDQAVQDIWQGAIKTKRISEDEAKYYGVRFKKNLKLVSTEEICEA